MPEQHFNITVRLDGLRPMMFDRYAGDNNTQLPVAERMYLDDQQRLMLPSLNVLSLLVAENTKSVCKQFFGKQWKNVALGISSYTLIEPFDIPIEDDDGPIPFTGWNKTISVHRSVARLKGGIPNPKERPVLALPWHMTFTIIYAENKLCTIENLRQAFAWGGTLGLGTFRPFFGRYEVSQWEIKQG